MKRAGRPASRVGRGAPRRLLSAGALCALGALVAAGCGPSATSRGLPGVAALSGRSQGQPPVAPGGSAEVPPSPPSTGPASTDAPTTAPPPTVDPGTLGQTRAVPVKDQQFVGEMAMFWQAVTTGQAALATPAFFPETAYIQLKSLYNDRSDWTYRLMAHFALDIQAVHNLLGPAAASARLVSVNLGPARWIPPGACANRLGYWNSLNSRVVYSSGGTIRSFGIAALDGWRGEWYIIHLGSEQPPPGRGVVDAPQIGTGEAGDGGGC